MREQVYEEWQYWMRESVKKSNSPEVRVAAARVRNHIYQLLRLL